MKLVGWSDGAFGACTPHTLARVALRNCAPCSRLAGTAWWQGGYA
jgi:hypothetical protein